MFMQLYNEKYVGYFERCFVKNFKKNTTIKVKKKESLVQ